MVRKIELVVNNCKECPYCHFESEIGEYFCFKHEVEYLDFEDMDIAAGIHPNCPLPRTVGIVAPTTPVLKEPMPRDVACVLTVEEEFIEDHVGQSCADLVDPFKCSALQVQELNECPEEWMKQVIAEEEAYDERRRHDVDRDVEKLFEGFDENDEPWDIQK